jgi:hypothetical protein
VILGRSKGPNGFHPASLEGVELVFVARVELLTGAVRWVQHLRMTHQPACQWTNPRPDFLEVDEEGSIYAAAFVEGDGAPDIPQPSSAVTAALSRGAPALAYRQRMVECSRARRARRSGFHPTASVPSTSSPPSWWPGAPSARERQGPARANPRDRRRAAAHHQPDQRVSVARWTTRIGNDCTSGTPFAPPVLFGVFHDTIRISSSSAAPTRW